MHFDDRLATVLRQPATGEVIARIQYRQLLDRLGTLPVDAGGEQVDQAYLRLTALAGEKRARIWRVYLAGCAHAFAHGWINLYQLLAIRPRPGASGAESPLPLSREYMYGER